ncbi:hypothetical protein THASP1DRAFT_29781 [Thamnocephalis sphaerospora]|uniref:Replication origin-binding protein domain-containing protein n=1 Tax=Thamnocephalis sphaerospora TaxID=78915 RepID=A0A4P9XQR9_9FUNG|nr:hypothetical protein THASP1DRAFT_29781 [Thamnocephalis sphaerospora]|eukprot:RKP08403.1 hypothetical protein THASP1DRAFT_29781 [Thamnocephalis sphaerospora]
MSAYQRSGVQDGICPRSTLAAAYSVAKGRSGQVWAEDIQRQGVNHRGDTASHIAKRFLVASAHAIYEKMAQRMQPSFYEVVSSRKRVRMYFDAGQSFDAGDLTVGRASALATLLYHLLHEFLARAFGDSLAPKVAVASACSPEKFSLRMVCRGLVLDTAPVSALATCAEFRAFITYRMPMLRAEYRQDPDDVWARSVLSPELIDLNVYNYNQPLRLFGNTDFGSDRPLMPVKAMPSNTLNLFILPIQFTPASWCFRDLVTSPTHLCETMVTAVGAGERPRHVAPSSFLYRLSVTMAYSNMTSGGRKPISAMRREGRFLESAADVDWCNADIAGWTGVRQTTATKLRQSPMLAYANSTLLDDGTLLFNEQRRLVAARDLSNDSIVHCRKCNVRYARARGQHGVPHGVPSAKVFESSCGDRGIFCINGCQIAWLVCAADQQEYVAQSSQDLASSGHAKPSTNNSSNIDFNVQERIIAIDAPAGADRTHAVADYVKANPQLAVMAIALRVASAKQIAKQLGLEYCQLEPDTSGAEHTSKRPSTDAKPGRRIVVCIGSLHLVAQSEFDVVLLDDAASLRYQLVSSVMSNRMARISKHLGEILRGAEKIILSQHRITESCIRFYCESAEVDQEAEVCKHKLGPVSLLQHRATSDHAGMLSVLFGTYVASMDRQSHRSRNPIIVFCTRADHAMLVTNLLQRVAREEFGKTAQEHIHGIWSSVQHLPWNQQFLCASEKYASDVDVLVVTPAVQAGHSFSERFRVSFYFLYIDASARGGAQLVSRLHVMGENTDQAPMEIQSSHAPDHIASLEENTDAVQATSIDSDVTCYMASEFVSAYDKRVDNIGQHYWIWNRAPTGDNARHTFVRLPNTPDTSVYNRKWVVAHVRKWVRTASSVSRARLLDHEADVFDLAHELDLAASRQLRAIMALHYEEAGASLDDFIKYPERKHARAVLVNIFPKIESMSASDVAQTLAPTLQLSAFLDFCLSTRGDMVDLNTYTYFQQRLSYKADASERTGTPLSSASPMFAKLTYRLLLAYGAFSSGYIFHLNSFKPAEGRPPTLERLLALVKEFRPAIKAIIPMRQGFKVWRETRKTANQLAGSCLSCSSISLKFHDRFIKYVGLTRTLALLRCIMPPTHFDSYRLIIDPQLMREAANEFEHLSSPSADDAPEDSTEQDTDVDIYTDADDEPLMLSAGTGSQRLLAKRTREKTDTSSLRQRSLRLRMCD